MGGRQHQAFQSGPGRKAGGNWLACQSPASEAFQSAPGRMAGGNPQTLGRGADKGSFNPPPAVRPGKPGCKPAAAVSSCSRFNPPPAARPGETRRRLPRSPRAMFQSAPGRMAGGNPWWGSRTRYVARFRSAPGREARGNRGTEHRRDSAAGFQSAPGRKAGGKQRPHCRVIDRNRTVSIRPRPQGRGILAASGVC